MDAAELSGAIAAERRLLEPAVRADPAAVSELLDDDFTEIGQTGAAWTRSAVIEALAAEPSGASVDASGWAVREVGRDLALVSYETRAAVSGCAAPPCGGGGAATGARSPIRARASSTDRSAQSASAASTIVFASACTCARCSGPSNDSA